MKEFITGFAVFALIVGFEIYKDYSLGDVIKDFAIRVFYGVEAKLHAQRGRLEAKLARFKARIEGMK